MKKEMSTKDKRKNLRDNLKYILKHFNFFSDNQLGLPLEGITISCREGCFSFSYGKDPEYEFVKSEKKKMNKQVYRKF